MVARAGLDGATRAERWLERRTYDQARFADLDHLADRKRELGLSVSAVLPAREVAGTIGPIVEELRELSVGGSLVDQILVVDAGSADGSAAVAAGHGAEVHIEHDLLPQLGPVLGKGDAMWRALSVVRGDIVIYLDSDTTDFRRQFVQGMLGPLLTVPGVRFVKALYSRPWTNGGDVALDSGARVTELMAKPLFNLFYRELTGFAQPLAGEVAAGRELLCSIPFLTGYAVETGMMIDVLDRCGLDAMAQVDLGSRSNRSQALFALSKMSYAVLRAVELHLRRDGRLRLDRSGADLLDLDRYLHAIRSADELRVEHAAVEVHERPPMAEVLGQARNLRRR